MQLCLETQTPWAACSQFGVQQQSKQIKIPMIEMFFVPQEPIIISQLLIKGPSNWLLAIQPQLKLSQATEKNILIPDNPKWNKLCKSEIN